MIIFLGAVLILVVAIAIWRELSYRRGSASSAGATESVSSDEYNKLLLENAEKDQRHAEALLEREMQHRVEMDELRGRVTERIHGLELEWAERKRADRQASNARSRSALVAKVAEHIAPLLAGFPYNPKDVRHIGELFDYLVLDGLEEGEIRKVVFLEVKTRRGGRVSNPRERMLRDAIKAGRVAYEVFVPGIDRITDTQT